MAFVSLAGCHTDIAVRAHTRAIAEAADPLNPVRVLVLQFAIETPSAGACRRISRALPQHAKTYGLAPTNIKCENSQFKHIVEFSSDVPLEITTNKSSVIQEPVPNNVLFRAFVATFTHIMRARRLETGYVLTLLYNEPLFASLQADLKKEEPLNAVDLSGTHLSLDLENDLGTNEVVQISSAFIGRDPIVHSMPYELAPQQSVDFVFSDVAVANFAKRHYMTLTSFHPVD